MFLFLWLFVTEYAGTIDHAMGVDVSEQMLEYAAQYGKQAGRDNVSFRACVGATLAILSGLRSSGTQILAPAGGILAVAPGLSDHSVF